ncbi:MAG: sensor histidine kinase [Alphaproteobacteria bacterium]|nr:sensor histidine kinase [Alphaproteobacteria bacterium]
MLQGWVIVATAVLYLCVLFAIAYWGDRRADQNRSIISNPYIYALSIAVYCTSWTFYGSVGRAASNGVGFLPIYLGPTLTFILGWFLLRKMIRISKVNRITSIADFIASRYGKSAMLSGLVTIIAVVGIMPYISLQLKAVSTSFTMLMQYPWVAPISSGSQGVSIFADTALYVAIFLGMFAILFGTRHIDASEHHEGMVLAVAFESVVKLLAFLAVGIFVTFGMYDGFGDIFEKARASEELASHFTIEGSGGYTSWVTLTLLSMAAIIFLPRQFQVAIVECVNEQHLKKAIWLVPLYLFLINIFVLPIAFGGLLRFPDGTVHADTFVLTLPMAENQEALALFAFIGGLSAATAMIIVATVALSTMVSNDLVMPVLLRINKLHLSERADLSGLILTIRRCTIAFLLLLGYVYVRLIGDSYALVSIGLVSFAAAAQFAPPILAGMYWKGGTRSGAFAGLAAGFIVWAYTLLIPSFARSGWIPESFLADGPFGIELLKPYSLFGLPGLDPISHALFWTLFFNVGLFVLVSLWTTRSVIERSQANQFVDVFRKTSEGHRVWRGNAAVGEIKQLVARFVGEVRMRDAFERYEVSVGRRLANEDLADAGIVAYGERQLAGAIGAASARIMIASVVREEVHDIDEMMEMLDEASQVIEYSRRLEQKSRELQIATDDLKAANKRLKELDRLKDGFISTVSHELRTPLTSIRSFAEIIFDNPEMPDQQRSEFVDIIVKESERLTRLIDDILDIAKMEAGEIDWQLRVMDPKPIIQAALNATSGPFQKDDRKIRLETDIAEALPQVNVDSDRLTQVIVNLISNAVKFCDREDGVVSVSAQHKDGMLVVRVTDNGIGIAPEDHAKVFQRFQQVGNTLTEKPKGTGLGLPICVEIVKYFGGTIGVESALGEGATFWFSIPEAKEA